MDQSQTNVADFSIPPVNGDSVDGMGRPEFSSMTIWNMQALFWLTLTMMSFFSLTLWYATAEFSHIAHTVIQSLIGFAVTIPMHWIYRWYWYESPQTRILVSTVVVLLFSVIWTIARMAAFIWMTAEGAELWGDFGGWYFSGFFIFFCWTAMYYSLFYYRLAGEERERLILALQKSRDEKNKRYEAERLAADAKMKMLRYQLNPHFLFNTLNAVSALVSTGEPEKAREMIQKLGSFLRYSLKNDQIDFVSLDSEIDAIRLYLEIEKTRFSDRLQVDFKIADDVHKVRVPSLIIQPLVENALKYAIAPSERGGKITVEAHCYNDTLVLAVSDDGPGLQSLGAGELDSSLLEFSGVGLRNIRDRLRNIYRDEGTMAMENLENGGLRVKLILPMVSGANLQAVDKISDAGMRAK